jgi:lipoprotein NlpI
MRYGRQDFKGALEDLDHCIALDPHLPGPYFNRAVVHDALGDRELATKDLERFLQIEKDDAFRKQAQQVLDLWRNPQKAKAVAEEVQPNPHR